MRNNRGNPLIGELGRATRFGAGNNCPVVARKGASRSRTVKKALKRLLSVDFSLDCPAASTLMDRALGYDPLPITLELLLKALNRAVEAVDTTELLAMQALLRALNGDVKALMWIELMVDGPPLTELEVAASHEEED